MNPNDCRACEGWTCQRCSPRLGEQCDPEADELSRLRAERDWARAEVDALKAERANAAGFVVCAYCGTRNRQGEETRAHLEACGKHPMAALRAEVVRLNLENRHLLEIGSKSVEPSEEAQSPDDLDAEVVR